MTVVGKVGNIFYNVVTPFHPFGGAVDIIVVQQEDGTFRGTPWYVRFGKFQGLLKGAEEIVRIEVNGVEANFHMYLDNSGEAYFVKEAVSSKDSEANGNLKDCYGLQGTEDGIDFEYNNKNNGKKENAELYGHESSVATTAKFQLQEEHACLGMDQIGRTDSDNEQRFHELQDEQSSLDDSVEFSEYGSTRYENLETVEHFVESHDSNSEVVLVSVDGQILTAPISSSEVDPENLQLSTPQFHLGPDERTGFCGRNSKLGTGESTWAADYLSDLETATSPKVARIKVCHVNDGSNTCKQHSEVCEGNKEHVCEVQETQDVPLQEKEDFVHRDASASAKREDIFKSCLELPALAMQVETTKQEDTGSQLEIQGDTENPQENSPQILSGGSETEDGGACVSRNVDELSPMKSDSRSSIPSPDLQVEIEAPERNTLGTDPNISESSPVHSVSNEEAEEQIGVAIAAEELESNQRASVSGEEEHKIITSSEDSKTGSSTRLEISLCGSSLRAGMGLTAAAEVFEAHRVSEEEFKLSAASIIKNENLVVRFANRYFPWDRAAHVALGMAAYGLELPVDHIDAIPVEQNETPNSPGITSTPSGRRWSLWPNPFRRVKTLEHTVSNSSNEDVFVDSEPDSQNQPVTSEGGSESPHKLIRTNLPTTEEIASLNLQEGQNVVTFTFSSRVLGMQKVDAHIYLWKWNARIVISDVDGTITKSDVLGQFMPLVGKDWTQSGVARLFSAIKENGYQLLFLSARAIVQAYLTRSFLLNLKQDGKALPSGPVVISPDGLFPSLYREVIRRAPHEFKIGCLEDIKALFPSDYNPFYAGFGNRHTDELSYRKVGIPKGKIFIINPKGEVAISQHRIDVKSYTSLHTLVNDMFPPTSMIEQEDYNSWNYWRMPLPDIDNL